MSNSPMFDPRQIPVIGVDTHLPAIPIQVLSAHSVRQRFLQTPAWLPEFSVEPRFSSRIPVAASVLVPLIMRDELTVLLTQRTAHLSSHSGQIAFPGGKADPNDMDVVQTALREAEEEIGLLAKDVEIVGTLPVYTTGSAFIVTPVVGLVAPVAQLVPNPYEVADMFEVPLSFLMNPAHHRHHAIDWEGTRRHWLSMPYDDAGRERFIWGATAGMLRNFYRFLLA